MTVTVNNCTCKLLFVRFPNTKMFFIIGLGLGDPKDVTVKGLEIIKKCERIYLESYTSILTCGKEALVIRTCKQTIELYSDS